MSAIYSNGSTITMSNNKLLLEIVINSLLLEIVKINLYVLPFSGLFTIILIILGFKNKIDG